MLCRLFLDRFQFFFQDFWKIQVFKEKLFASACIRFYFYIKYWIKLMVDSKKIYYKCIVRVFCSLLRVPHSQKCVSVHAIWPFLKYSHEITTFEQTTKCSGSELHNIWSCCTATTNCVVLVKNSIDSHLKISAGSP